VWQGYLQNFQPYKLEFIGGRLTEFI